MDKPKYKRVLLKLSGEALAGDRGIGINNEVVNEIAVAIKKVREIGLLLLEQGDFVKEEYELTEAETGTASILSIANMNKGKSNEE